jgi:ribosomal protein L16 Arg81 hydroxylase
MSLERILGDMPKATFLSEFYLRQPLGRPGGAKELCDLASWDVVREILGDSGRTDGKSVPREPVDFMLARQNRLWDGAGQPSYDEVRRLHAEGYTLVLRHVERHHPRLAEVAEGFRRDFLAPVDMHIYCTPENQFGFGWHYDAEDVFIVQTEGSKEYSLRKNTVNPWPLIETLPADMRLDREIMPVMKCRLEAGDWLYIPGGYWHMGQSQQAAISLAIGFMSTAAIDVLDFLRGRAVDSLLWRQRLAPAGAASPLSEEELETNYRELFATLAADLGRQLANPATVRAFIAGRRQEYGTVLGGEAAEGTPVAAEQPGCCPSSRD